MGYPLQVASHQGFLLTVSVDPEVKSCWAGSVLSVPQLSVAAGRTQTRFGVDEWPDVQASLLCAGVASLFLRRASHWDWSLESVPNSLVFMTHLSKDIVAFADAHEVEHCAHFATNTKVWHGDSSCTLCVLEGVWQKGVARQSTFQALVKWCVLRSVSGVLLPLVTW